jgi:matrix metalloproteinase-14 (membrane-inserted)
MQKARCGNPDLGTYDSIGHPVNVDIPESLSTVQGRSGKAPERYVAYTHMWPKKHLKWFIEEYPKQQKYIKTNEHIRRIITQAFQDWEKHSGLKFEMVKTKEKADLKLKFHSNDHGDGYPFDGQGATLAHAFYPTSGDIHFDDDEFFTDNYTNENEHYTLRLVAAHEIGHALGLSHSFEAESLMYPVYQQVLSNYSLSTDDQQGIQSLYGKVDIKIPVEQPKTTLSPSKVSIYSSDVLPIDNWCSGDFQTGCEGPDGELYLFKDNQVWRYQARKKRSWDPQPTLINERFPSLPDTTITACVKSSIGYTYLFRNYRMWRLKTHWNTDGPHILRGKHYPQNPRVALLHQNSIYLIQNRLIYRLNEFDFDRELEIGTIDKILNPPPNEFIRSGFTYAKRHYIFTKELVYVYDSTHGNLLHGYPKSITNGWFACESASQASKLKKKTTTMRPLPTKPSRKHDHDEDDDEDDQHFDHHHHHHHHRPRRPFHHRNPPHAYRRRWED